MLIRFLIYGIVGWIIEILWTGFHSFLRKDYSLMGNTSLLMFPIYGLVLALEPAFIFLVGYPLVVRGGVYMLSIFLRNIFLDYYVVNTLEFAHGIIVRADTIFMG